MSDSDEYDSDGERNLIRTLKKSSKDYDFKKLMKRTKPRNDKQAANQGEKKLIKKCKKCSKVSNLMCGQCQSTVYCSKQCQQMDWESHKMVCE